MRKEEPAIDGPIQFCSQNLQFTPTASIYGNIETCGEQQKTGFMTIQPLTRRKK